MTESTVEIVVDDTVRTVRPGKQLVRELRSELRIPKPRWLALQTPDLHRFLVDDEVVDVKTSIRLATCAPLVYKGSPKHKRQPHQGRKGTLCPSGLSGATLLAGSCMVPNNPRRRWATDGGFAYCAMFDNAGTWHGYPVPMTDVPATVWKSWLALGKITSKDLRTNA